MSAKKNLPNIPIYIGDWERDCNVLSLESEAAWLRIIFKLWTKGKQNAIKIPTKSLQNLWRCDALKMREILDELLYNDIADIRESDGFVEFICRRFVKENEISEIRSKSSKGIKTASKSKQTLNKTSTKEKQITENEIDIKSDIKKVKLKEKGGVGEKEVLVFPWDTAVFKTQWKHWKVYKSKEHGFKYKTLQSEQAALFELQKLSHDNEKRAIEIIHKSMANGWQGLFALKKSDIDESKANSTEGSHAKRANDAVDRFFGQAG